MKRSLAILLAFMLALLAVRPAFAHDVVLLAAVSVKGQTVTVRLLDQLASQIPGARVTVGTGEPGKSPSHSMAAPEQPTGIYSAPLGGGLPEVYQLSVSAVITAMEFKTSIRLKAGEDMAERMIPLVHIEPQPLWTWGNILYMAAALLLVVATVVALVRRRSAPDPKEGRTP